MNQQEKTGGSSTAVFLPLPGLCAPLPHSHLSSPACHSIWHVTAPHLLTSLLLSPSWGGGRWQISSLRKTKQNKSIVIIAKQSCRAFQISVILVTFSFRGQTKPGKKPWASSLLPDTAYLLSSGKFPPYSSCFKSARFVLQWCQELWSGCFPVPLMERQTLSKHR